ncbi:hypothetical protein QUA70_26290 [Microcoleus sp. LAD1_D5]
MIGEESLATESFDDFNGVNGCREDRRSKREEEKPVRYLLLNDFGVMLNF